jgi:hypothetical protein
MKQQSPQTGGISRRNWLALAASALAGCGGGGGIVAALPGTGGTGIFAQGAIAGFGSVIVNGIKFDDSGAAVQVDGIAASSQDLRLGMVAAVQGASGADPALGVASQIEVWSIAQGAVSLVRSGAFGVAGMTIQANSATVYEGIASASSLAVGQNVAVWGLQSGADGSQWIATRVALIAAAVSRIVTTGLVVVAGVQRSVNGLALRGTAAAAMTAGQLVRVKGVPSDGGLQVEEFKVLGLPGDAGSGRQVEVEGVVTQVMSPTRFMLGNIEVDSSAIPAAQGAGVAAGLRIQVRGTQQGQLLRASALESESEQTLGQAEIEGAIQQYTSLASFVVRGQRCDASAAAITQGKASDLAVGVKVKVEGTKAGDVLRVSRLEIGD